MTGEVQCQCPESVRHGDYSNQDQLVMPLTGKSVGIDRCIAPDITALWAEGIETIESCCGHGICAGYIAVKPEGVEHMLSEGWKRDPRTDAPGVFLWPKSESVNTAGKLYACMIISRDLDAGVAMQAMRSVINAKGWRWAEVFARYKARKEPS